MKTFGFTASEFIGWIRLVRPGSVLGPQQFFLEEMEQELRGMYTDRVSHYDPAHLTRSYSSKKTHEMSPIERKHSKFGDKYQATRLLSAKKMRDSVKA